MKALFALAVSLLCLAAFVGCFSKSPRLYNELGKYGTPAKIFYAGGALGCFAVFIERLREAK